MDELRHKVDEAKKALKALEDEIYAAKILSHQAIDAQFSDALSAARAAHAHARLALNDAIDATATHEWEGRIVQAVFSSGTWARSTRIERGVVEVCRTNTNFPANVSWRKPHLGAAFVRKLKKDGTPGTLVLARELGPGWRLAE